MHCWQQTDVIFSIERRHAMTLKGVTMLLFQSSAACITISLRTGAEVKAKPSSPQQTGFDFAVRVSDEGFIIAFANSSDEAVLVRLAEGGFFVEEPTYDEYTVQPGKTLEYAYFAFGGEEIEIIWDTVEPSKKQSVKVRFTR